MENNIENTIEEKPQLRPKVDTAAQAGGNFVPTEPLSEATEESNIITPQQQNDYTQESMVEPVPAQNQLPADSYLYANTTSIGGLIQSVANQYSLDPHQLEALTNTIRNNKANLSGFYNMQIGYFPGMSAESLVTQLGRVADLSNTVSDRERQEAEMKGQQYTSNGLDSIIDSLQSIDGKKAGKLYYQEALSALQEADHMKFDTPTLSQYYETLIKAGHSKASAWTQTMKAQDEFRAAQDTRAVKQDLDNLVAPEDMSAYVAGLYEKVKQTKDPETRLRLYGQYQAAEKIAKSYAEAFKSDPAAYLQTKDPSFQSLLSSASESGDFSNIVTALDKRYDELGVPQSQRKYLRADQVKSAAKEINTFLASDPIKAQSILVGLNQAYGKNTGKVINQLISEGKVSSEAKVLIEAIKTGSPASNEDVLTMMKYKLNYKGDFAKEMLGAPDKSTAQTMMQKLEARVYGTPGYKALVNQLDLAGNVQGKTEMAQYYANMAAYYKYKNPRLSDKQAVEMVQKNLIDSVYDYSADGRIVLQKRTLDGKTILYNNYDSQQTASYLSNREFTGQKLYVGGLSQEISERLLRDNSKIKYRTIDQFTVQPIYDDGQGTMQPLFTGEGDKRKVFTLNLRHLGEEDIIGILDARDSLRKLTSLMTDAANIPGASELRYAGPIDNKTASAMKALNDLGFDLRKFDTTKPFNQQFDRTKMNPARMQALSDMMIKQNQFETKLQEYRKLQKAQRDTAAYFTTAARMIKPFIHDILIQPKTEADSRLVKFINNYNADREDLKPDLKRTREELYKLEDAIMKDAAVFLEYKGNLPKRPLTKNIQYHNVLDSILWGGY